MNAYREDIEKYIKSRRGLIVRDVVNLCGIDSSKLPAEEGAPFGPGALKGLEEYADLMRESGLTVKTYDNYMMSGDLFGENDKKLDIIVHIDVVKGGSGWTVTSPFSPVLKDGMIYARGASDNKGPAVAALYAVKAVKELGIPVKHNVRIIAGTDEETDFIDIKHYHNTEEEAEFTIAPDLKYPVTNVEKGQFRGEIFKDFDADPESALLYIKGGIATNMVPAGAESALRGISADAAEAAAKRASERTGIVFDISQVQDVLTIKAVGTGAHCARCRDGNNAVTALMELICSFDLKENEQIKALRQLSALFPYGDHDGDALGIALRDEKAGDTTMSLDILDIGPSSLYAKFDSRTSLLMTKENTIDVIRDRLAENGMRFEYEFDEPHAVPEDYPLIQKCFGIYEEVTGKKGYCQSIGISSYAHFTERGIAFGAEPEGMDTNMHGPDEYVSVDALIDTAVMIAMLIADVCA